MRIIRTHRFFLKKSWQHILILMVITELIGGWPYLGLKIQEAFNGFANADTEPMIEAETLSVSTFQNNTLMPIPNPVFIKPMTVKTLDVILTGYSSRPEETDDSPFVTASGKWVRNGIVANNRLPFGTKIRIPELYGDEIFVVEDRMNPMVGSYQIDIWFPSYWEAADFGAKRTLVEVVEG